MDIELSNTNCTCELISVIFHEAMGILHLFFFLPHTPLGSKVEDATHKDTDINVAL